MGETELRASAVAVVALVCLSAVSACAAVGCFFGAGFFFLALSISLAVFALVLFAERRRL